MSARNTVESIISTLPIFAIDDAIAKKWIKFVLDKYNESHRKYHTINHIKHMLDIWNDIMKNDISSLSVDEYHASILGIVFHDIEYNTQWNISSNNELNSSIIMRQFADEAKIFSPTAVCLADELIISTKLHLPVNDSLYASAFIDADMAILASALPEYSQYVKNIRAEWSHIDAETYIRGRKNFIVDLLETPRIFFTDMMYAIENTARDNLRRELSLINLA